MSVLVKRVLGWGPTLMVPVLFALGGCAEGEFNLDVGLSGRDEEFQRVGAKDSFAILSQSSTQTDIAAHGRRVRIEPAKGLCIAEDSISVAEGGAFAMIADCAPKANASSAGPGFPGVLTVSISGEKGFNGNEVSSDELSNLKAFLDTPLGRQSLSRGGNGEDVKILETREIGDALYVHVESRGEDALAVFAPRFWRAFVRVNERLVLATASGFAKRRRGDTELLSLLAMQITQMRQANLAPVHEEELRLAEGLDGRLEAKETRLASVSSAPSKAPVPASRIQGFGDKKTLVDLIAEVDIAGQQPDPIARVGPVRGAEAAPDPEPEEEEEQITTLAPDLAPAAPKRPG